MLLKAAVIGAGKMGSYHANIYQQLPETQLVGLSVNSRKTARQQNIKYSVPVFIDYQKLINQLHPDIVSIASPTSTHVEIAKHCLAQKIHVLLEKPIAPTLQQVQQLQSFHEKLKSPPVLMIGFIERFNPVVVEAKKLINRRKLGRLRLYSATRSGPRPPKPGSDVLLDLGIHDLDLFHHLTNQSLVENTNRSQPTKTFIQQSPQSSHPDYVALSSYTDSNLIFHLQTDWLRYTPQRETRIVGDKGELHLNFLTKQLNFISSNGQSKPIKTDTNVNQLEKEIHSFVSAVRKGQPSPVPISQVLFAHQIYDRVLNRLNNIS